MTMVRAHERHADNALFDPATRRIRLLFWSIALILGALQTWAFRFPVGEDGVSYLDIADAYMRGDWHNAFSAYWSPLYSMVLAAGFALTRPSPFLESTVVHLINFLLYVMALAAFDFMLRQLLALHRQNDPSSRAGGADTESRRLSDGVLLAIAYGVFIWVAIDWIGVSLETPDTLLSISLYLVTGLLLRMRMQAPSLAQFAILGLVLGLAYLTKSALLPLSMVFLAVSLLSNRDRRPMWGGVAVAAVVFAVVSAPYVAIISTAKGRLTFGDTGKLAYVWFANGATDRELHWQWEFPDERRPVHPTRKVLDRPAIYEYGSDPVGGSYPVWYDPSYWHEGETPHFDLRGQLRVLHWSAEEWWHLLVEDSYFMLFGAFVLLMAAFTGWRSLWREAVEHRELIVPAVAASAMYSLVLLSPRYVAVFLGLFWIGLFASVRLPRTAVTTRLGWGVATAILLMIALRLAPLTDTMLVELRGQQYPGAHRYYEIAEGLKQLGAKPGDKVARMGYGPPAYWARLAGVRIVAEMFSEEPEFESIPDQDAALDNGALRPEVVRAFAGTGARFLIAWKPPADVARQGWTELGTNTQWFAYPVQP